MHTEEENDIPNFVLREAENISVLFRFPWELLLNPSLCAVLFLSTGAALVNYLMVAQRTVLFL